MPNTNAGYPYVDGSELVKNWPAALQALAVALGNAPIPQFTDSTARDSALGTTTNGRMAYLTSTSTFCMCTAAGWQHWDLVAQTYTPTLTQSGAVTKTVAQNMTSFARYWRRGKWCDVEIDLAVTGSGTGANEIIVGLPLTGVYSASLPIGLGSIFDSSASAQYLGFATMHSTTAFKMFPTNAPGVTALGAASMTAGLANGDVVRAQVAYEFA